MRFILCNALHFVWSQNFTGFAYYSVSCMRKESSYTSEMIYKSYILINFKISCVILPVSLCECAGVNMDV